MVIDGYFEKLEQATERTLIHTFANVNSQARLSDTSDRITGNYSADECVIPLSRHYA